MAFHGLSAGCGSGGRRIPALPVIYLMSCSLPLLPIIRAFPKPFHIIQFPFTFQFRFCSPFRAEWKSTKHSWLLTLLLFCLILVLRFISGWIAASAMCGCIWRDGAWSVHKRMLKLFCCEYFEPLFHTLLVGPENSWEIETLFAAGEKQESATIMEQKEAHKLAFESHIWMGRKGMGRSRNASLQSSSAWAGINHHSCSARSEFDVAENLFVCNFPCLAFHVSFLFPPNR